MKIIFCLFGLLAVTTALPFSNDRVVGGTQAPDGAYPWQVSLRRKIGNSHFCGGSLISENHVMTACHCKVTGASVGIGSNRLNDTTQQMIEVDTFTCNPNYGTPGQYSNDFAVIQLKHPAMLNKAVAPILLAAAGQSFTGMATTTGWGYINGGPSPNTIPNELQVAEVPLIDQVTCNDMWALLPGVFSRIDETMQCAGAAGASSCNGDSGGPLVQQVGGVWTLVGAVSWGSSECNTAMPGVYARIAYDREWISSQTGL